MRGVIGGLLLLIALLWSDGASASRPLRVLFVGNSLTYYNDLPATFASVYRATAPGAQVETEMLAQGGGKLRERLDDGQLASLLTHTRYDVVVLQELGGFPDCPDAFPGCADAPAALREAVNLVRANGARAIWFSTWQALPEAQHSLSASATALAHAINVEMVDVGAAMQRVPRDARGQLLHKDGHPSALGTWLTAAALVQAVAPGPLPDTAPARACGIDWHGDLKAASPASAQRARRKAECHAVSSRQWRVLRDAVRP